MSKRTTLRHADWLTLVDPSGPFLTLPVLRRVWSDGLDRTPPERCVELREQVEELGVDEAERRAFVDWVLRSLLSFGSTIREGLAISDTLVAPLAEHGVLLRPDLVVVEPGTETARLLVNFWAPGTDFAGHVAGEGWAASPVDRMATLCRRVGVQLGMVTDGDRFTLVWAPHSGPVGRATWVASVFAEAAERTLLDSFTSVLGAKRFFSVGPDDRIEALLAESASAQSDVTSQLGLQVRRAVELLVAAFSRANAEKSGQLLSGLDPRVVYEAACIVMMRLVFLLSAEERRLLPLGDELYDRSYAVSTLRQSLREVADAIGNDETLEHAFTAWPRLLATFRAVHGGLSHDQLRLPAYGGRLFDPDRYPFLEGRTADESWRDTTATPIPVDDRTMLGLLTSVQILQMREGGVTEARRLSFRSLDVEQIGHVYEGLLDHGALRVEEVTVGLVGKSGEEAEVSLAEVEHQATLGTDALVAYLVEQTKWSDQQVRDALTKHIDDTHARLLRVACDNNVAVFEAVKPYGWLLRDDVRELPMVLLPGYVHVTEVSHRRDTGTEYTTKELADEVVRYALEPLVYAPGPAEGAVPEDWRLKSSAAILDLRVCDPAVGSGAIITAACRYLSERLVEAWTAEGALLSPAEAGTDDGDEIDDVLVSARRRVAERCLYGVDRDPMAVEMAKLSLWLITMAKDRPFSFLDHAFRAGDSLLGVTGLEQVRHFNINPGAAVVPMNFARNIEPFVKEALDKRRLLEESPVIDVRDAETKARLLSEADVAMRIVNVLADLVVGAALSTAGKAKNDHNTRLAGVTGSVQQALLAGDGERDGPVTEMHDQADAWLNEGRPEGAPIRRPLHWPLAFPEVFLEEGRTGFDAVLGNPPFLGGKRISGRIGSDYRDFLVSVLAEGRKGSADLVAYFFLRAAQVSRNFGFIATNTVAQGDTREVALDWLLSNHWSIHRAVKSEPWPGNASLSVAKVWLNENEWQIRPVLDGQLVQGITAELEPSTRASGVPFRLETAEKLVFQGSVILGVGFTLDPTDALRILERDERYKSILFPYLSGEDVNSHPQQQASRYVINFHDWSLDKAREYPICMEQVERDVRPLREKSKRKQYRERWWQFAERQTALYRAISGLERVLVIAQVSKIVQPVFVSPKQVLAMMLNVFVYDDDEHFGLLTSGFHYWWTIARASTLETRIRYAPSDCFETFPQPHDFQDIGAQGKALNEFRRQLMTSKSEGLTATYNRLHEPDETGSDICTLREFHVQLDEAVATAYGWTDLQLAHGFWQTRQGMRYTIGPEARTELLDRLLELNHLRHEELGGLTTPKAWKPNRQKARPSEREQASDKLFGDDDFGRTHEHH